MYRLLHSMPTKALSQVHAYIDQHKDQTLSDFFTLLRIPSISALRRHDSDSRKAADLLAQLLRDARMEHVEVIETQGLPLIYADWLHAQGKPTVLLYAHYDVQPVDPVKEWTSDPFEPRIEGDNVYARGASDDKLQAMSLVHMLHSFMATQGTLPVNIRLLYEGEEESGGTSIEQFVRKHPERLQSDIVVVADGGLAAPRQPMITYSCRGILHAEIEAQGAIRDLHSGSFGGNAPNPLFALAQILTGLKDAHGHIHIPGLYEMMTPVTDDERNRWKPSDAVYDELHAVEMGTDLVGEPGYLPIERGWARPTLEVHGFVGGFQDEGTKTVIPAKALAKISLRLVPGQTPDAVFALLEKRVRELVPQGITARVVKLDGGMPFYTLPTADSFQKARQVLADAYAKDCWITRTGGSIPIAATFQEMLQADTMVIGFGLGSDNIHSPNEHTSVSTFLYSVHVFADILSAFGE